MPTENFNLPLIADNMANDVVRDMNALAEATDEALKGLGDSKADSTVLETLDNKVTQHLDDEAKKRVNTFGIAISQSIPPDTAHKIPWTLANIRDTDAIELIDNNRRIKAKIAGDYQISAIVNYDSNEVGYRAISIEYDGTASGSGAYTLRTITARASSAFIYTSVQATTIVPLQVGDIIDVVISHNAGVPLLARTGYTALEIIRL